MKMWAGRFESAADSEFEKWQSSFSFDRRLLKYEVRASKAHASALYKADFLSAKEYATIVTGLEKIEIAGIPANSDDDFEDVHHFVESELVKLTGDTGYKLHTSRSRNEQIATDLRLYVRDQTDIICTRLADVIHALLDHATNSKDAVMPAYTHLQRAEPVLVAHWLLAYAEMFFRDIERLTECRRRLNACVLGSAAVAGAFLPLDRQMVAADLGFARATSNSIDATSDRDFAIEFVQCAALIGVHLSRMAEELILFCTSEFGFVHLPDLYSTGSSAMPQKKNPDALELIRGKCGRISGAAVALLMTCKGLPLAYNKDLQETQVALFDAVDQCASILSVVAGFLRAMRLDFDKLKSAAQTGQLNATAAAAYLARKGVPFRKAHELVGKAVRKAIELGCELEGLTPEQYASIGVEADEYFYECLSLESVVAAHDVVGGTSPSQVRRALEDARTRLEGLSEVDHARA